MEKTMIDVSIEAELAKLEEIGPVLHMPEAVRAAKEYCGKCLNSPKAFDWDEVTNLIRPFCSTEEVLNHFRATLGNLY